MGWIGYMSSAGNTRGLIEAKQRLQQRDECHSLPRGIPAASLKPADVHFPVGEDGVFRGEYPRPH